MTKARRYRKRFFKRKYPKYKRKTRGMQRIKSVRWPARNIGGDRSYCKLRYVKGARFTIPWRILPCPKSGHGPWRMRSHSLSSCTLSTVMGSTPNLSTMASLYTSYRIRGIKVRLTYWQTGGVPCFLLPKPFPIRTSCCPLARPQILILLYPTSPLYRSSAGRNIVYVLPLVRVVAPLPSLRTTP